MHNQSKQTLGLVACLAITFVAAAIGGTASVNANSFYSQLVQPAWAPPSWVFGPVWTALYIMMGVAAWLVWRERGYQPARFAITLFLSQLALNSLWSWLFFGWQLGAWAFANILVLWILIVMTMVAFFRIRALPAWLMVPYLFWVSFAAVLNYAVWQLNPTILG
jgi:tryptophan-rich sensory protein